MPPRGGRGEAVAVGRIKGCQRVLVTPQRARLCEGNGAPGGEMVWPRVLHEKSQFPSVTAELLGRGLGLDLNDNSFLLKTLV